MRYSYRLHPETEKDFIEAYEWYEDRSEIRHCEPCATWRSNPQPTRRLDCAGDCFVPSQ